MVNPGPRFAPISFWRPGPNAFPECAWFGLSTRHGGVSQGAFASLNLGRAVGDEEDAVLENRRRLSGSLDLGGDGPLLLHQVHGTAIVEPGNTSREADGFLIRMGDPWVAISAADCAPVALVDEDARYGALIHCGWRGARGRIAAHAILRLATAGTQPQRLRAAIGPCLHACCFPIGPEVAALFDVGLHRAHPSGKASLDLPEAIRTTLLESGIRSDAIQIAPECTSCADADYYSHRRDGGVTGRHWALLRLGPASK